MSDITGTGATEEATVRYLRSPLDALRLAVFVLIGMALLAITLGFEDSILGFEEDVLRLFGFLGRTAERVLFGGVMLLQILILIGALLLPLVIERYRLLGYFLVASLSAIALMSLVDGLVERQVSSVAENRLAEQAGLADTGTVAVASLAQIAAIFVVAAPFVSRRWRRAGSITITLVVLVRLLVAVRLPADLLLTLPLGAACGAAVLLLFGRPDRRPTHAAIRAGLVGAGLSATDLQPGVVRTGGTEWYDATLDDGTGL
ncbi:MAG: hypothetical protein ACERLM_15650, partial [Acidimicrobiales bacterium]